MFLLLLILPLLLLTSPKIYQSYLIAPLLHQNHNWFYLGRQTLSPGTSSIHLSTTVTGIPFSKFTSLELAAIHQSQWNPDSLLKCECNASKSANIVLKMNGDVSEIGFTILESEARLYYFVLRDCAEEMIGEKQNYNLQVFYTLTVLNNDSHLGHYENCFFIVMMLGSSLMLAYKLIKDGQKTEERDWIVIGLFAGLLSQAAALGSKIFAFVIGWKYGFRINLIIFNVVYAVLGSFGDSLIATILIFVSFGWTIIFVNLEEYEKYIPPSKYLENIVAMFSFAHILLSILGLINETLHSKYHIYDSIPGIMLIVVKFIAGIIFVYGVWKSNKKASPAQQRFLIGFGIVGVLYILIVPITYLVCEVGISEGKQEHYAIVIKQTLGIIFNILFVYNLVESNSKYRVNRKRHTFLPVDEKFY